MLYLIIGLIILACLLLWVIILVQNPKGGGLSSQMGGSTVTNIIGAKQSGDVVEKATWITGGVVLLLVLISTYITAPSEQTLTPGLQEGVQEQMLEQPSQLGPATMPQGEQGEGQMVLPEGAAGAENQESNTDSE